MKHMLAISLLLLAAVATVRAETGTLGFEDATLDVMPPTHAGLADLVGGTLAVEGDVVRATISLAALPEMTPGMAYLFEFENDTGRGFWLGAITAPDLVYLHGTLGEDGTIDSDHEASGSFATGAPGSITIEMPLAALERSRVLSAPSGLSAEIKGGAPDLEPLPAFIIVDEAVGTGELVLAAPQDAEDAKAGEAGEIADAAPSEDDAPVPSAEPTASAPSAPVPGFAASLALGGALGALLGARRISR